MTSNVRVIERGDAFTARELKDLTDSRAFNVLVRRIDKMIDDARNACESADSFERLKEAQGALRALRTVKQLPAILIREVEAKA